eukprot:m.421620 g.421620  ORF g.421620 m.421620 type:complete len:245 (+) comp34423_c0_seq1:302-1036(+)
MHVIRNRDLEGKLQWAVAAATLTAVGMWALHLHGGGNGSIDSHTPIILDGGYRGQLWRKPNSTISTKLIISSPFAQCELHEVQHPTKPGVTLSNWMWFDEGDHVNIIVHGQDQRRRPPSWIVFRQSKYAFRSGKAAVAPVGGYINEGETAAVAARREVLEELGLECRQWHAFGEFRTAANRGGGFCHPFVAKQCAPSTKVAVSDDLEGQDRTYLSDAELRARLMDGSFQEIKWTATVALALLLP